MSSSSRLFGVRLYSRGGPVGATWKIHSQRFKDLVDLLQIPEGYEPCSSPRCQVLHDLSMSGCTPGVGQLGPHGRYTLKGSKTLWSSCRILKFMILATRQDVRFFRTFRLHAVPPGGPVGATWRIHPEAFKNLVELLLIPEGYEP